MDTDTKENERPFENDQDRYEYLTIGDLLKLNLPSDYVINFDGFWGSAYRGELEISHKNRRISIND